MFHVLFSVKEQIWYYKYITRIFTMCYATTTSDIEDFAAYMGLNGIDSDMFYEQYYHLNVDDEDEEYMECWSHGI